MTPAELIQAFFAFLLAGDIIATLRIRADVKHVDTKIDAIGLDVRETKATVAQHGTEIALLRAENSRVAAENTELRLLYRDMAGFLQGMGFKKRDGPL